MNIAENQNSVAVFLFCVVVFVQNFLPTEISAPIIITLALLVEILTLSTLKKGYVKLVLPLIILVIIGIFGMFDHESRNIFRDIAYGLTPISLVFIGFWMAGRNISLSRILKLLVLFGVALSVNHLSTFVLHPELLNSSLVEVRETAGGGNGIFVVLVCVIGMLQHQVGLGNLFPKLLPRMVAMPVLIASIYLSFSRTEFAIAIILFITLWSGWRFKPRYIFAFIVVAIGFVALSMSTPEDEVGTFRSKLARSTEEVSVSNYEDMADINSNWRGFESYRALETFSSGENYQKVFGQGYGALADLGIFMTLGGTELRFIPIFHNGYFYVLLKMGVIGLVLYAFFYINVLRTAFRWKDSRNVELRFSARILMGIVFALALSMYVVGGMAEMHDSEMVLLLGYFSRLVQQYQADISLRGYL